MVFFEDCNDSYVQGLPKDTWELSQQAGRGGWNGDQAAFVIILWPGQTGQHTQNDLLCCDEQQLQYIFIGGRGNNKISEHNAFEKTAELSKRSAEFSFHGGRPLQ